MVDPRRRLGTPIPHQEPPRHGQSCAQRPPARRAVARRRGAAGQRRSGAAASGGRRLRGAHRLRRHQSRHLVAGPVDHGALPHQAEGRPSRRHPRPGRHRRTLHPRRGAGRRRRRHPYRHLALAGRPGDPRAGRCRSTRLRARKLLADLGADQDEVFTRLRAYRPGSRAVVEVRGPTAAIFLKLVPVGEVEALHRAHQFLAEHLPVPRSLGFSRELGLLAMQALPGTTLRDSPRRPHRLPAGSRRRAGPARLRSPALRRVRRPAPPSTGPPGSAACSPICSPRSRSASTGWSPLSAPTRSILRSPATGTSTRRSSSSPQARSSGCSTSTRSVGADPAMTRPRCWVTSTCAPLGQPIPLASRLRPRACSAPGTASSIPSICAGAPPPSSSGSPPGRSGCNGRTGRIEPSPGSPAPSGGWRAPDGPDRARGRPGTSRRVR